jgi:hypothetical protein
VQLAAISFNYWSNTMAIIQEFNQDNGNHRLVNSKTKTKTNWAPYRGWVYLEGVVGFTGYYGVKEGVLSADEFCKMAASAYIEDTQDK